MSFNFNGTDIKKVIFDGTEISDIYYNETKIFTALDPTKMNLTQDEFIAICNAGLQSQMSLGAKITLNNTYCNTYEVIGINHDSTTNTVDIMPTTQVGAIKFDGYNYETSTIRTWINGTYLSAFDTSIQNLAKTMNVKVATSLTDGVTLQDKVKLLSAVEMNCTSFNQYMLGYGSYKEGEPYTIFTAGDYDEPIADRWRIGYVDYGMEVGYWLRSLYTRFTYTIWEVYPDGYLAYNYADSSTTGVLPVLRF